MKMFEICPSLTPEVAQHAKDIGVIKDFTVIDGRVASVTMVTQIAEMRDGVVVYAEPQVLTPPPRNAPQTVPPAGTGG